MTVTTDKQKPDTFIVDKQELKPGLIIFRRTDVKHRNWYCRIKIPKEDRYKTVSLGTPDINAAKTQAFYEDADVLIRVRHQIPVFEKSFAQVAKEYSEYHKGVAQSGEITMGRWKIVDSYIRVHLVPYAGHMQITRVGNDQWRAYPLWRKTEGGNVIVRKGKKGAPDEKKIVPAKDGTIGQEMKTLRAILNFAADKEYIRERQVPDGKLPSDKARREEFTPQEYKHLHTFARGWIKLGKNALSIWYRTMAYNFMLVMTNTGMRPPESRNLRWPDYEMRTDRQRREFVCLNVRGKDKYRQLVASPNVGIYLERVRALAEELPYEKDPAEHGGHKVKPGKRTIKPNDFVFINATGASSSSLYGSLITDLLTESGLLYSSSGSRRSTYCFRHTYATFRLIEGVDVFWLAKQMGTSVKMIEKHYGHITPTTDAGRILQGTPGWDPIADAAGETPDSVNAGGAGKKPAKPRTKK